jgi:predicted metal-dependent phosphoesterase TrpH
LLPLKDSPLASKTLPDGGADLHVHTTYSDGALSPAEVVEAARAAGLSYVGITDHDSIEGISQAVAAAKSRSVQVVPGVEISTRMDNREVHILGLFIRMKRGGLGKFLKTRREERKMRIHAITAKLNALGVHATPEEVFAVAGHGAPGRMHVAVALLRNKRVRHIQEAFHRFIGDGGPAYVPREIVTPRQATDLIRAAGGVPVLAHPGLSNCDELIPSLVKAGVMGIEVYYPAHTAVQQDFYLRIAKKHNLLLSGGSDNHGGFKGIEKIGQIRIAVELVARLQAAPAPRRRPPRRH